jgi:hypothetical protein
MEKIFSDPPFNPTQCNSPDKLRTDADKTGARGKDSSRASTSHIEEEEQEIEVLLYQEEDEHRSYISDSAPPSLFEDGYSTNDLEIRSRLIFGGILTLREVDLRDEALHTAVVRYHC